MPMSIAYSISYKSVMFPFHSLPSRQSEMAIPCTASIAELAQIPLFQKTLGDLGSIKLSILVCEYTSCLSIYFMSTPMQLLNVHACIQYVNRTTSRNGATLSGQGKLEHLFTPYVHLRLKLFEKYNSNEDRIECVNGIYNT